MNTKQTLCLVILFLTSFNINGQYRDFMTFGGTLPLSDDMENEVREIQNSINLTSGFPAGIGVELAHRFKSRVITRFTFHFADVKLNQYKLSFKSTQTGQQNLLFDVNIKQSSIGAFADYLVSPRFRFWGGMQYLPANTVAVSGELSGIVKFNDVSLNGNDLGSGILTMGFRSWVTPSVGIGFGKMIPDKKWAFSLDVGAQYRGNYTFDIKIKEGVLLKKNEENSKVLEHNFNKIWYQKIFPLLQLRCSYNFKYKKTNDQLTTGN